MKTLFRIRHGPLALDIGVILLCVLFCELGLSFARNNNKATLAFLVNASRETFRLLPQAASAGQTAALLVIPVHALLFYIAGVVVGCGFLPVIYFAFLKARLRAAADKKLYATEQDLYYFRDTFPGMKPATVSMLVGLDIDAKKDVPASLLQMVDQGQLALGEAGFAPGDARFDMSASEAELARFALGEKADLSRWKALSIEEGIATGFLQTAGPDGVKRQMHKFWVAAFICFGFAMLAGGIVTSSSGGLRFFGAVEQGIEQLWLFFQMRDFAKDVLLALLFWVVLGAFLTSIALMIYATYFTSKYEKLCAPVRRSAQGERVARRLYGIKNYIHDFTLLGEATQKHVALWNDFLVYAIVLEENTDIVREIGRHCPSRQLPPLQMPLDTQAPGGKSAGVKPGHKKSRR